MKKFFVMIITIVLMLSLVPAVLAENCYRWDGRAWVQTGAYRDPEDSSVPVRERCQPTSTTTLQWSEGAPEEPPEGARRTPAPSEPEETPATSPSAPPEGTSLSDQSGGQFTYSEGRWIHVDAEGNRQELAEAQQRRLTDAYNDPQRRGEFQEMGFSLEEAESPPSEEPEAPSRGAAYTGPRGTYRTLPEDASEREIDAALERCRNIAATQGQCHRDGRRIVMGPEERARGRGEEEERAPERGGETEIHFFPPVEGESEENTLQENLEIRRAACQEAHAGRCTISGDRVVFSRDETPTTAFYGAYAPGSAELRENLEQCDENHGDRCWSDDRGNIQYRRADDEQSHEYWMYNPETGEIEPTTEAACGGDSPDQFCCADSQEDCEEAGNDYEAAVEQSRIQNIWEGKQWVRGWIKIFDAFGLSDEWDREAFEGLHRWVETKAGLAITGRWEESICRYTPDFDNPTALIQYPGSGQFGVWIEGAKTMTLKRNESDPRRGERLQKLYKITGSVMPAGLTHNSGREGCTDRVKFTIMLNDDVIDLGEPGSAQDVVDLNCDSAPYSLESQNALYIISRNDYERICWRFQDTPLHAVIREQLRDGKLCARIVESGTPEDLGCKQARGIDCSQVETAPTEDDSSRGGTGEPEENRPAPRPPTEEI